MQRTVFKGLGKSGRPVTVCNITHVNRYLKEENANLTKDQESLVYDVVLNNDIAITLKDLLDELNKGKTKGDLDDLKKRYSKKKPKKKPNALVKKTHKKESGESQHVNDTKQNRTSIKRGNRLRKRGQDVYEKIIGLNDTSCASKIVQFANTQLDAINKKKSGDKHNANITIDGVHLSLNIKNVDSVTDIRDVYANIHASLTGTNKRSSYAALVYPDPNQDMGPMHPLDPKVNENNNSLRILNIIEILRNQGDFIPSILQKHRAMKKRKIKNEEAIKPNLFGTHELSEVSGGKRDLFKKRLSLNTISLHDQRMDDSDEDSLREETNKYLDADSDDDTRTVINDKFLSEFDNVFNWLN